MELNEFMSLVLNKLDRIDTRLDNVEKRLDNLEKRVGNLETAVADLQTRVSNLEERVIGLEEKIVGLEERQGELYLITRAIEENIAVTRAEQDKMAFAIYEMQGKLNYVVEKVEEHDRVINYIKGVSQIA